MSRKPRQFLLEQSVDSFEAELRRLATDLARSVLEAEFARVTTPIKVMERKRRRRASAPKSPALVNVTAGSAPESSPSTTKPARSSTKWTRDAVISELGRWLIASKNLDMSFLKRHGPRGLVDAAKRFFGRFDAALNAANLAIAPQMEGRRPAQSPRQSWPPTRELAHRQRERGAATAPTTSDDPSGP